MLPKKGKKNGIGRLDDVRRARLRHMYKSSRNATAVRLW
jgi:hypothetical protein